MSTLYNKNNGPFLSIIIATLNAGETLEKCLKSIIHQTSFNKIEILVKDGGSTDETINILKKYDNNISCWESSSDEGIYDAWNKILTKATGKWILFLGADDTLFENSTISGIYSILKDVNPEIDIAYGRVRLVSNENETILDLGKCWRKTRKCIKEKMCIPHQGIFHKRSLFSRYGYFSINYYISSDYDFIRRAISDNNVLYLDLIISCMQIGGISSIPQNTFTRLKEIRQINKNHGSRFPGKLWVLTYSNACLRYLLILLLGEKKGKFILDSFRKLAGLPPFWTKT
jgi:glycosyltransferase involved in cell wall biosynthesis